MEKTPFLGAENELQKIYSNLGVMVPVGDLSQGKAPAIQPLPATSTTTSITAKFNVMSGADISSLSYKVNDGEAVSLTPAKGVVTITIEDIEYNSGPYEIELTATNETGSTVTSSTVDLQPYTDWATADEVLEGNKFIGEDGQEAVGTYVPEEPATGPLIVTTNGEYTTEGTEWVGFDDVFVDVPTGPDSGGAVIESITISNDGGFTCDIIFSTMPDMNPNQHNYSIGFVGQGFALSGPYEGNTVYLDLVNGGDNQNIVIDMNESKISFYDVYPPVDSYGNYIEEFPAYVYIYEDGWNNLKYSIPCTVTNLSVLP